MTEQIKIVQRALDVVADGVHGPVTMKALRSAMLAGRVSMADGSPLPSESTALRAAVRAGRVRVTPAVRPAPPSDLPRLPWVAEMTTMLGKHEDRDNAELAAWMRRHGKYLGDPSAWPWCGDAVETAIVAALPDEPLPGAVGENPFFARNWAPFGRRVDPQSYGAIGVFERGPRAGHVGFLVGHDSECWHVLGGNQGDRVSVVRIARRRLLTARWPVTWPHDPVALPRLTPGGAVSVNEA